MFPDVQTMNNYINGGRGGAGGEGHWNGTGGAGGDGMGPRVNFDIRPGGNLTMNNMQRDRGIDILHRAVALEAIHDSTDSFMEPKCHPETRTQILEDLRKWALDPYPKTTILWLYGPAGAGKSAIMRTLASQLHENERLGGCFFFKRGHATRGTAKTLFATIAYQLALNVEWLRTPISQVVEKNPSILARSIGTQMQELIYEPCRAHEHRHPLVIVIDGLDECDGHAFQREVLRAIRNPSSNHPIFLRFLIASRPEPRIREVFESPVYADVHRAFNVEQSFDDVRKYLRDEFGRIHREHRTMARTPSPWPELDVLNELVWKSSGYFIYASTIIKFIDDKSYRPTHRLELVLKAYSTESESPFDALDQLYLTILSSAPRQSEFMPVLCIMTAYNQTISIIEDLLGLQMGETELLLHGLHSVIKISSHEDRIASYHASFLDFLDDASRSQKFHTRSLQNRTLLARCFLNFSAGRFQWKYFDHMPAHAQKVVNQTLIPLITSLPPSAELCPLIGRMNLEYIFNLESNLEDMVSWLKKIPSAPRDLIQDWQNYVFMYSFQELWGDAQVETRSKISQDSKDIVLPGHDFIILQAVVAMVFLDVPLRRVSSFTGILWDELKASMSSIRRIISRYDDGPLMNVLMQLLPREAYSRACGDLALRLIPRLKDRLDVWKRFPLLVRLSPFCPELYRELWSIPIPQAARSYEEELIIHHVSKWLESFPEPTMELIAFWRSGRTPENAANAVRWVAYYHQVWEGEWREHVKRWNETITRLDLPDDLKFPL
ncbi:hypothetical protein C8R45DRAFT_1075420 [Mycena sanguinolenta]|nr:hypothetical protein C8R45DRAFT_1075420 [Mycena sanguinolenta]